MSAFSWALAWALGAWNATGSGRHHWPGRGGGAEQLYNFSGRLLDPTALAHTTAGRNLTVPAATAATFSQFWAKVATARASIMPAAQWPRLWLSLQVCAIQYVHGPALVPGWNVTLVLDQTLADQTSRNVPGRLFHVRRRCCLAC